jgi:hypothetical protein
MILQHITQSLKIYFAWLSFSDKLASPNTPSMKEPGRILAGALHFNSEGPQKE